MKKTLSIVLAVAMLLAMTVCCASAEGTKIQIEWPDTDSTQVEVMEGYIQPAITAAFPDVEFEYLSFGQDENNAIAVLVASGDAPDIAYLGGDCTPYIESNVVINMRDYLGDEWINSHFSNPDQLFYRDGGFYFMAPGQNAYYTPVFYYNKTMFDELGLTEPANATEFKNICQTLVDNGKVAITASSWVLPCCLFDVMIEMNDSQSLFDLVDGTINWDDEGIKGSLAYLDELLNMGAFTTGRLSYDDASALAEFASGEAGMWLMYSWMNDSVSEEQLGFEPGMFSAPATEGEEYVQLHWDPRKGLGGGYCAISGTEDEELVVEILKVMIDAEATRHNNAGVNTNYIVENPAVPSHPLEIERLEEYNNATKLISVMTQGSMDADACIEFKALASEYLSDDEDYMSEQFIEDMIDVWEANTVAHP